MVKADHDIGNLHACIVDVILHFHVIACGSQHPDKGVAENGIAQMSDVRGLVGIDVGMLDDDLAGCGCVGTGLACGHHRSIGTAVEPDVDIAVAGHLEGRDAGDRGKVREQLAGDGLGRFFQASRQLKRNWQGHLTERGLLRLFDYDFGFDTVLGADMRPKGLLHPLFDCLEHCFFSMTNPGGLALARYARMKRHAQGNLSQLRR